MVKKTKHTVQKKLSKTKQNTFFGSSGNYDKQPYLNMSASNQLRLFQNMPKLPSVTRERSPRVSKKVKAKKKREDQSKVLEKVLN